MVTLPTASGFSASERLSQIDFAVASMERTGILVSKEYCDRQWGVALQDEKEAHQSLQEILGADRVMQALGPTRDLLTEDGRKGESGVQLQSLLHEDLKIPRSKYWKKGLVKPGETKLDATSLGWLAGQHPEHRELLVKILDLRRARGCLKYLKKLPGFINAHTGRVHPCFGASSDTDDRVGAITGRLACKYPELQQIPKDEGKDKYRIRGAFVAGPGNVILECDYTALEVVILADIVWHLFQDDELVLATNPGAADIHSVNALYVYRDFLKRPGMAGLTPAELKAHPVYKKYRDTIKTVWYGLQYGKGAYGFGYTLFDEQGVAIGEEAAGELVDGILDFRRGIRKYQDWVWDYVRDHRGIPSLDGRWCDLSDLVPGKEWAEKRAWRRALNFPMQATGAAITGAAMFAVATCPRLAALGFRLILQVHDALMLEGPEKHAEEARSLVSQHMVNAWTMKAATLQAPGKYGPSWEGCR